MNLAFDANQMSVALLWHGQFMDASRHWTGRGNGWQPPLGYSVVKFPTGVPFAIIGEANTPWPKTSDRAIDYQFVDIPTIRFVVRHLIIALVKSK